MSQKTTYHCNWCFKEMDQSSNQMAHEMWSEPDQSARSVRLSRLINFRIKAGACPHCVHMVRKAVIPVVEAILDTAQARQVKP